MIIFYIISLTNLLVRTAFFVASCFVTQLNDTLFIISAISTITAVGSGVSHSQNLTRLIFDLAIVKVETKEEYDHILKRRIYFHFLLGFWVVIMIFYIVTLITESHEILAYDEMILFGLLGIQLLVVNFILMY